MYNNKSKDNNAVYIHKEKEYHYHLKIIHNELRKYRTINIPNQNIVIKNQDLEDWIIEKLSPKEIAEIIYLLENAKKRSSSLEAIFQVIAASLQKSS
ncbi:hypothetical protein [Niallia sp.]|uniref:hypothetical protein n=1 Tax=Niallia sp. TaxID=2837523 RepID=UPI00289DAE80|nr:hypothetical protein [Niallia sp.]